MPKTKPQPVVDLLESTPADFFRLGEPEAEWMPTEEEEGLLDEVRECAGDIAEQRGAVQAQALALEFRQPSRRRFDAGKVPIAESPLFGGPAQTTLGFLIGDGLAQMGRPSTHNLTPKKEKS